MDARRLAILCSHLRPLPSGHFQDPTRLLSNSICASSSSSSSSDENEIQQRFRDSKNNNNNNNHQNDCVFCNIIRGESPAFKLYEDDTCLCIMDTNPLSHGHSLIIPKSHFPSLEATPPSVVAAMCSKVPFISNAIMKVTGSDSFNLVVNNGVAAGQVIFHTHIHIIPRKMRDRLWPSENLRRRPLKLDREASKFVDHVREELSLLNNQEDSKDQGSSLTRN